MRYALAELVDGATSKFAKLFKIPIEVSDLAKAG